MNREKYMLQASHPHNYGSPGYKTWIELDIQLVKFSYQQACCL